ncbi:MAG: glycosyltransferase family 4 protein [Chloroflexi bacterium]|nr:glycosyltransferase family 4 protein [Chloroflexota bacterium]
MRVLFVALGIYTRIGGMERFNQRVVRCLAEITRSAASDVQVISLWDSPRDKPRAPAMVSFTPASSSKVRTAASFARTVHSMQPDVILYGHVLLTPIGAIARALSPRSHNLLFTYGIEAWGESYRKIPVYERWAIRSAIDHVVSISVFTENKMAAAYGLPSDRFRLLPCAIDIEPQHNPLSSPTKSTSDEFQLLTVARLAPADRYKGCDMVIRALPKVLSVFPTAHYNIVGEGPLKEELHALAKELGVIDHVHLLGYLDDDQLESVYERSHLFVMPSSKEGFGIVFLEAWKHGLPVISGNVDASPEVIAHGVNGLTVNPYSVDEIGEAIITLLGDRDEAVEMGQEGYQTVLQRYTHDHFRQTLAKILAEGRG